MSMKIECEECKAILTDAINVCHICGGKLKVIKLKFNDSVGIYDGFRLKKKQGTGKRKVRLDSFSGYERSNDGNLVYKERIIDQDENRYYEKVVDGEGNVIRECDEKLTEHKGRGSAKNKQ